MKIYVYAKTHIKNFQRIFKIIQMFIDKSKDQQIRASVQ